MFESTGINPKNSEIFVNANNDGIQDFQHASHLIDQTYLKAPDSTCIFVRKKNALESQESDDSNKYVTPRQALFEYECRTEQDHEFVKKKRIMDGREYESLIDLQSDPNRRRLTILRTNFLYEKHYFRLETLTNIAGSPTFLRVESHQNGEEDIIDEIALSLPPFVPVVREVTGDDSFRSAQISKSEFKLRYE